MDSEYCEGDGPRVFAVHYTKAQFRNPGGVSEMEHDSSRSGYHEPEPGSAGLSATEEDWGDDYPKTFSVNLIWAEARDKEGRAGAIGLNGGMPWHLSLIHISGSMRGANFILMHCSKSREGRQTSLPTIYSIGIS